MARITDFVLTVEYTYGKFTKQNYIPLYLLYFTALHECELHCQHGAK
jgi:hypothetical protein